MRNGFGECHGLTALLGAQSGGGAALSGAEVGCGEGERRTARAEHRAAEARESVHGNHRPTAQRG